MMRSANTKVLNAVICGPFQGQKYKIDLKDEPTNMPDMIYGMRAALKSMSDGEITAWVALVENLDGGYGLQFPSSMEWIIQNQLPDGSWGDSNFFLVHDRIINILACIVALEA
ncbi:hypothetical protein ACP4OV_005929 [Aristida adscensionis]